jgi:hypothetical protein
VKWKIGCEDQTVITQFRIKLGKGEVPLHDMKAYVTIEVLLRSFLTSALDGV